MSSREDDKEQTKQALMPALVPVVGLVLVTLLSWLAFRMCTPHAPPPPASSAAPAASE